MNKALEVKDVKVIDKLKPMKNFDAKFLKMEKAESF